MSGEEGLLARTRAALRGSASTARRRPSVLTASCVAAAAFILASVFVAGLTSDGLVRTPDSGQYLAAASNIVNGRGVTSPIAPETSEMSVSQQIRSNGRIAFTEWPPAYPTVLAVADALGASTDGAARWVNVAAAGFAAAVLASAALQLTSGSLAAAFAVPVAALAGPVLTSPIALLSVNVVAQSMFVLSETLFLPFALAALLFGGLAAGGRRRRALLVAAVAAVAVATLVRYVGMAAGVAAGVGVAVALGARGENSPHRGRWFAPTVLMATGPAVIAVWSAARTLFWGDGNLKSIGWHPPGSAKLGGLVDVGAGWLGLDGNGVPAVARAAALVLALSAASALAFVPRLRSGVLGIDRDDACRTGILAAFAAFMWVYPAVVVASVALVDKNVPLDQRILGPAGVALDVVLLCSVFLALRHALPLASHWLPQAATVLVVVLATIAGASHLSTSAKARGSAVAEARLRASSSPVRRLPGSWTLFTNRPGDLYADTGRPGVLLPSEVILTSGRRNRGFTKGLDEVGAHLMTSPGAVVLYRDLAPGGPDLGTAVEARLGLKLVAECNDGLRLYLPSDLAPKVAALVRC